MIRKVLFALLIVALVPLVAAAEYLVVLKDGRRLAAREKYTIDSGTVHFISVDGQAYRFALGEIDVAATNQANAPAKKEARRFVVWTNDELERLRPSPRINVVGERPAEASGEAAKSEAAAGEAAAGEAGTEAEPEAEKPKPLPPREQDPETYRERLRPLRTELADVERQISDLQRTIQTGGGTGGGVGMTRSNPGVDPRDTLQRLQRRRDDIQRQIGSIEAEARRNGISPGQIR